MPPSVALQNTLSPQMLAHAQSLPGGTSPKIRWLLGKAEEIALAPPYALITAGRSLHWLDWPIALPRFAHLLTPNGLLAIVQTREQHIPWEQELRDLLRRYVAYDGISHREMITQLEEARLFQRLGEDTTSPMVQQLSLDEYIARQHSKSACSLDEMPVEQAAQFDAEAQTLLAPYANEGVLTIEIVGIVIWGKPLTGQSDAD